MLQKVDKQDNKKKGLRHFTVSNLTKHDGCSTHFKGGLYRNKEPKAAAKKAFTEHCRVKRIKGVCSFLVTVRETTRGSANKEFTYKIKKEKLADPIS